MTIAPGVSRTAARMSDRGSSVKARIGLSREHFHDEGGSVGDATHRQPNSHTVVTHVPPYTPSRNHHPFSCGMPAAAKRVARSQNKRKVVSTSYRACL